ncbi:MAG: antitoxin family protein, partial [Archaeoglobaceae archaeon]|nr:antitoxin family protein [Archaeoglobaceae archaeon]MDW8128651.1 antitoxin family protein [Archaeoglobaceae archaeon]
KIIEAVYENGVFKPLEKVELREGEKVKIKIEDRIQRRRIFLENLKPIKVESISIGELKKLRNEKYELIP